ncbi:MAG: hypothetical protein NT034_03405 [Candidatus Magasanikbacteria bacterium]|nr:hypothetical protein [Candidatus Magasanikbacteria bacterium]
MKIISRTDSLITIKDLGAANWVLTLVCLVLGPAVFYVELFNGNWTSKLVAALFCGVGLYLVFSDECTLILVDKAAESIIIKRSRIVSSDQENYRFDEIAKIILKEEHGSSTKGGRTISYNIQLILKDGEQVNFVNNAPTVSPAFAHKQLRIDIAKEVSGLVGVPFEEQGTPGLGEVLGVFKQVMEMAAKGEIKNMAQVKVENNNSEENNLKE